MGCSESALGAIERLDVQAIIEGNARILREHRTRLRRFPQIYELYGTTELISTFSHLTPNLPFDEVFGNFLLPKIADAAGIPRDRVINCAYDNYIPRTDTPKSPYDSVLASSTPKSCIRRSSPASKRGSSMIPTSWSKMGKIASRAPPRRI
jgi:hypothetical protein